MSFVPLRLRSPALLSVVAVVVFVIAAVACWGGWPGTGTGSPRTAPGPRHGSTARVERLLHDAEQLLLRTCMRRAGFDYHPVPGEPGAGERAFPYVLDDPDWASRHGYGRDLQQRQRERARRDPNGAYFRSLSAPRRARALVAANGPGPRGVSATLPTGGAVQRSDHGCVSDAQRRLYGDLKAWFQASTTVHSLDAMRRARVVADHRYARDLAAWAQCMRRAGHPYATPGEARAAALSGTDPLPRAQERALALAEVRCAERSGLAGTARELDARHDAALRRQYRSAIAEQVRLRTEALPRARAVVGDAGRS
ncbi:hypothetical protein LE181_07370 [Streptomyces sp. SCA3-4]|uniref:hypothetical protein n=1 Tax=Streptomyces sichuanensis TaxID=2871810 RepID=UPI001CE25020|nr:hypothetical protein [Streptomyces sichuanensis]MCA6091980.1 hypothetical protein [Streptomyces sichuanensis]